MKNKTILLDIDDVVADLITPWLSWYNAKYVDNLKIKSITDWNIDKFVKPVCGRHIYDFPSDPNVYKWLVKPIKGARRVIKELRANGNRVVFVTAFNKKVKGGVKLNWLNLHGFNVMPYDYLELNDKSIVQGDLFIDDGWHNISTSSVENAYLYTRPWNLKYDYDKRVGNWKEIAKLCGVKVGIW